MKYIQCLLILVFLSSTSLSAQNDTLASYSINAGYSKDTVNNQVFQYTIGQLSSESLVQTSTGVTIEIGFLHCIDCKKATGVESVENDGFSAHIRLFPNPTSSLVYLESDLTQPLRYRVISMDGKSILSGEVMTRETIDLQQYAEGIYAVLLYNQEGKVVYTAKITKY